MIALVVSTLIVSSVAIVLYAIRKNSKQTFEDVNALKSATLPDDSLFPLFQPHLVPLEEIRKNGYGSVFALVQFLIGVLPTSVMVLVLWPPAFDCFNLVVPNFLNLPQLVLAVNHSFKDLVSLAMYVSSRANGCAYCSAHCCSFAARRGVDHGILHNVLQNMEMESDDKDVMRRRAVARIAHGLGSVPVSLTEQDVKDIYRLLSPEEVEWIVAAIAMFGYFNKLMDGLGIPLESSAFAETVDIMDTGYSVGKAGSMLPDAHQVREPPPPHDDWTLKISCLYHGLRPGGALALDSRLMGNTPRTTAQCMEYLTQRTGYSFPILEKLKHERFFQALTAIIARNFCAETSAGLGIPRKIRAGLHFAEELKNVRLKQQLDTMLAARKISSDESVANASSTVLDDEVSALVHKVTEALSSTPNQVTPSLVHEIRNCPQLTAPMLVELVSFLAMVQMLHRLESFYEFREILE